MAAGRRLGGPDTAARAFLPKNQPGTPITCGIKATASVPQRGTGI